MNLLQLLINCFTVPALILLIYKYDRLNGRLIYEVDMRHFGYERLSRVGRNRYDILRQKVHLLSRKIHKLNNGPVQIPEDLNG